jgi:hypothetical protein
VNKSSATRNAHDRRLSRSSGASRAARLTFIGGILTALITAVSLIIVAIINDDGPDQKKPSAKSSVQVTFTKPSGTPVKPKTDVFFEGLVNGLGPGHVLWLVSRSPKSNSLYYIVEHGPVATRDGPFKATAFSLGNESDLGSYRTFLAVVADPDCSESISTGLDDRPRAVRDLAPSCQVLYPGVRVAFLPQ